MKKKLSLVLAVVMAASMLAGCKKTDESSAGLPDITPEATSALTQMTTEATTAATVTTTEATTTATEAAVSDTEPEPEPETTTSESETTAAALSETTAAASSGWSETELDEVFYIKENCYSRKAAIVGSEAVKQYSVGQKIIVVAATDTGYYKLEDGTFIHSDYLSEEKPDNVPAQTTAGTTSRPAEEITAPDDKPSGGSKPASSSYKKSYTDRYPYKQLSSAEKQLYANIVDAAENFAPSVTVPDGLSGEDVFRIYVLVFNQEPQLFWLPLSIPHAFAGEMSMSYALSSDEAAGIQKQIDSNVKSVMSKVAGYSSTTSKLKVIYDWVIQNNTFSLNSNIYSCSVCSSLTGGGQLQCQGYSKTVQYLCDVAGIDCMVVTGTNQNGDSHAWNIVYCDNGYYIFDATRGDPYGLSYAKKNYERYYFFLANDDMIRNSHQRISMSYRGATDSWVKIYDPPACTKTACYYFKAYNKEFSDYDSAMAGLKKEIDDAISSGKQVAHIRVTDKKLYDKLRSNDAWKELTDYAKKKSKDVEKLSKQTPLTEDLLVVHYDVVYK